MTVGLLHPNQVESVGITAVCSERKSNEVRIYIYISLTKEKGFWAAWQDKGFFCGMEGGMTAATDLSDPKFLIHRTVRLTERRKRIFIWGKDGYIFCNGKK